MIVNYVSGLGPYIEQMIAQKHAVGYPYKTSERVLYMFDRFCAAEFPGANTITPEIGNAWAVIKPTEKTSSFLNRLAPVRELARYMIHRIGPGRSTKTYSTYFFAGRIEAIFPGRQFSANPPEMSHTASPNTSDFQAYVHLRPASPRGASDPKRTSESVGEHHFYSRIKGAQRPDCRYVAGNDQDLLKILSLRSA